MKYRLHYILTVLFVCLMGYVAIAQEETPEPMISTEDFPLSVTIPEGFDTQLQDDTVLEVSDGETLLRVFPATSVEMSESSTEDLTLEGILSVFLVAQIEDFDVDETAFSQLEEDDLSGVMYETEMYRAFVLVSQVEDETEQPQLIGFVILEGDLEEDILFTFLTSIERPVTTACLISTDQERTVRLHVGPGINRTSVAFLPVGETFEPLGEAEANDGSRWFKLDKSQAAPNSSALEIWVAVNDVMQVGDCTVVGEASAPPIIPIIQQSEPSNNESDDTNETTTGDDTTTTSPTGVLNINDLGPAEITITLDEGVFTPTFNQFAYYVVRVTEEQGLVETELCARSSVSEDIRCSVFETYQLVGLNTFQSTSRSTIYMIFNSPTSYGLYSATNGGALNTLYIRSRDTLPDEIRPFSTLENR
ncbi:MAG: hypothetical protein AAF846_00230 [Chloroflexota bacterium]